MSESSHAASLTLSESAPSQSAPNGSATNRSATDRSATNGSAIHEFDRFTVLSPQDFDATNAFREQFALDVLMGLSTERKFIPSMYFYDAEGSRLFQEITDLDEYYPTACEQEILERHKTDLIHLLNDNPFSLVELGAGDGRKTKVLLQAFLEQDVRFRYVPIDISEDAVRDLCGSLKNEMPAIECHGVVSEYFNAIKWLNREDHGQKFVLFLGSNIGNFDGPKTRVFLRTLWNALDHGDYVLIGFDLKKDIDVLLRAYNDSKGVTSQFNRNVLARINRELDANFQCDKFQHYGAYDVNSGAMESYLISLEQQVVTIGALNKRFDFRPYEPIHLEYSYKFLPEDVTQLSQETGFREVATFFDSRRYFVDALWQVEKH